MKTNNKNTYVKLIMIIINTSKGDSLLKFEYIRILILSVIFADEIFHHRVYIREK